MHSWDKNSLLIFSTSGGHSILVARVFDVSRANLINLFTSWPLLNGRGHQNSVTADINVEDETLAQFNPSRET